MYDICCIGHITSDKVSTPAGTVYMPGGTAYYFSYALCSLPVKYLLVTAVAESELHYVTELRQKGIEVRVQPSTHTVYFENIYGDNPDERTQNVLQKADAFTMAQLQDVNAKIYHLGPLLADDFGIDLIKTLAAKGDISLDVQGYLRKVVGQKVFPTDWPEKAEALQYVKYLKADEAELHALTGCQTLADGVKQLTDWGVQEAVITNGSKGSVIYHDGILHTIPAYPPKHAVDATGCGDTYMAGYLYQRSKGAGIDEAGHFAAKMASLKMESAGPLNNLSLRARNE
jgi:sugar/nucleoside kinase (ribokinase family)